jgi:peptidoglycan/xylan/chitin deacetylase (PgdA/CDA1 family)
MVSWRRLPVRRGTRWVRDRTGPRAAVLMYHGVSDVDVDPWGLQVSPRNFAAHLDVLTRRLLPAALAELVADHPWGRSSRKVAVTFDDGYANNLHQALPVLARFAVPATVFAVSGQLTGTSEHWWDELARVVLAPVSLPDRLELTSGRAKLVHDLGEASPHQDRRWDADRRYRDGDPSPSPRMVLYRRLWDHLAALDDVARRQRLAEIGAWAGDPGQARDTHRSLSPDEVRELAASGLVAVGSHTVTHPFLPRLHSQALRRELVASRSHLEQLLGQPVTSFSYPFGAHDAAVVSMARSAGYGLAVTGRPRTVGRAADPLQIGRFDVKDWDGEEFERRLLRWIRYR